MGVWTNIKSGAANSKAWLKRHWAPAAAGAAVLATTLGFITDVDNLLTGGRSLSQAEAATLAASVATHLEASSVARGGDYGSNSDLERVLEGLSRASDRRVVSALTALEARDYETAFEALEDSAHRLARRDAGAASERWFAVGVVAESVDPQRAISAYEAALDLNATNGRAMDRLGNVLAELGNDVRAETLHRQALDLALENEDEREQSRVYGSLGGLFWLRGDFEQAEQYYALALELADLNGDLFAAARHLGNSGLMAEANGDDESAERFYERAIALMEQANDPIGIALAQNNLAGIYRSRGELDRAEDLYRQAQATFEAENQPQRTAMTLSNLGRVAEARGDFDAAARFYQRALERARQHQYLRAIERAARDAGWLAFRRNDMATARSYADEALAAAEQTPDPAMEADALLLSLGVAASTQDDVLARDHAARAIAIIETRDVEPGAFAYIHDALALSAYFAEEFQRAQEHAGLALSFYEQTGDVPKMAEQQLRLGSLAFQLGETEQGCTYLAQAEVSYGRSGFVDQANRMVERRENEGCPARDIGGEGEAASTEPG
ncbi:tetratricopeptide repeat protein [Hyphobacterium sp.]|uniref:tetratricopeptide repeat protein n=1 Tax=Hyphobacterium sp. TaxID=2004662 RepID=UPI003BA895E0